MVLHGLPKVAGVQRMEPRWAFRPDTSLGARDLKLTPRSNRVVTFRRKETIVSSLDGKIACELSKHVHGVDPWWILLKKKI